MNTSDEEIQNKLEANLAVGNDLDSIAYRKVFNAVSSAPTFQLSSQFADKVILKIEAKESKASSSEIYWLVAGVAVLFVAAIISGLLIGFKPSFGAFTFWASYPGLFAFAIGLFILIQWADKKIVKTPSL